MTKYNADDVKKFSNVKNSDEKSFDKENSN